MLTTIAAIAGLIFGASGLLISILNYRRDRPSLTVSLDWDSVTVLDRQGKQARFARIYITNSGRRPIYVTSAGIEFDPPRAPYVERTEKQGQIKGRKLGEGDPPLSLVVTGKTLDIVRGHAEYWKYVRAFAVDSTGKRYLSLKLKQCPPWGVGDGEVPYNFLMWGEVVECDLEQHQFESYLISGQWVLLNPEDHHELVEKLRKAGINESIHDAADTETPSITVLHKTKWPNAPGP